MNIFVFGQKNDICVTLGGGGLGFLFKINGDHKEIDRGSKKLGQKP